MKLTTKILTISMLGISTIVGGGFAAWTFNSSSDTLTASKSLVTSVQDFGNVLVTNSNLNLVLDQKEISWTGSIKASRIGVCATKDTLSTWTASLSDSLSYYVRFSGDETSYTNVIWKDDVEITLPKLEYVEEHKPTTLSQYNVMVETLQNENVNFEFTASIN
jgi:hypothetical protein